MAKMTKKQMAETLKNNGYFRKYKYVSDIVKNCSWDTLNCYFREMLDERNINWDEQ